MKNIHFRAITLAIALNLSGILLAIGLVYSVCARAEDASSESMSKEQYESLENNYKTEYRLTKVQCRSLSLFASYLCILKAKNKKDAAIAELEANYKRSAKNAPDYGIGENLSSPLMGTHKNAASISLNQ